MEDVVDDFSTLGRVAARSVFSEIVAALVVQSYQVYVDRKALLII